jgi:hypothetical protein
MRAYEFRRFKEHVEDRVPMVKFCTTGLNLDTYSVANNQHVSRHVKKLCAEIVASVLHGRETEFFYVK